ncbi:MAG: bifunctional phosphoribosyl-AMP cyclohydrolase/phosphoribosyl-ATP diphosphatase HisIE [Bacillota bacterium]
MTGADEVRFGRDGLVPAVAQDAVSGQVLMLAYMDREALARTLETGETWYWSRSRQDYWHKGETSGHVQRVRAVWADCDRDALLIEVEQEGPACHQGDRSCFHNPLTAGATAAAPACREGTGLGALLTELDGVIESRRQSPPEGSYVRRLLDRAPDAICKKVGEEATEVVMASKNADLDNLVWEVADLWFHTLVLLHHHGLSSLEVAGELRRRRH